MLKLNERFVVDVRVDGIDYSDYPDFCGAYFASAIFEDTGIHLTDAELAELENEYPELIKEMAFNSAL